MTRRKSAFVSLWIAACLAYGFWVTWRGMLSWDTVSHIDQGRWLVGKYFGLPRSLGDQILAWYGPFWMLIVELLNESVFAPLNDTAWVYHAMTASIFPGFLWL